MLGKMVDQGGVGIVGSLWIVRLDGFGTAVSIVKPERGLSSRFEVWNSYPDKRFVQEGIEFFDVIRKQRFIVFRDKTDVAAVILGICELEIAVIQPDQKDRGPDWIRDRDTG